MANRGGVRDDDSTEVGKNRGIELTSTWLAASAIVPLIVAVAVAIVVWRSASRQRGRRVLREGLADPSPARRRATLEGVDQDQLARDAPAFVELLSRESDPTVLDALASAVARSRWEPTDNANLVELRRWVAGRHAHLPLDDAAPFAPRDAAGGAAPHVPSDATSRPAATAGEPAIDAPRVEPVGSPSAWERGHVAQEVPSASTATALLEPTSEEIATLVPKVREVLGKDVDRVELVSIDGRVLATWTSKESAELN